MSLLRSDFAEIHSMLQGAVHTLVAHIDERTSLSSHMIPSGLSSEKKEKEKEKPVLRVHECLVAFRAMVSYEHEHFVHTLLESQEAWPGMIIPIPPAFRFDEECPDCIVVGDKGVSSLLEGSLQMPLRLACPTYRAVKRAVLDYLRALSSLLKCDKPSPAFLDMRLQLLNRQSIYEMIATDMSDCEELVQAFASF